MSETKPELGQREGEFFDKLYESKDSVTEVLPIQPAGEGDWIDYAMRVFGDVAGKRFLDLGCGQGYCTVKLALSGATVLAVDASQVAVDQTLHTARMRGCSDRVEARNMTVEELETLESGSFDGAFGSLVLHHLPDMTAAGALAARLVKPGGKAVFCENSNRNPLARWGRRALHGRLGFRREGTEDERQLSAKDISQFGSSWKTVKIHYPQFVFFQELSRTGIFRSETMRSILGGMDGFIQRFIPVLRRYSVLQVVEFNKS